jgi:hypothetical protein
MRRPANWCRFVCQDRPSFVLRRAASTAPRMPRSLGLVMWMKSGGSVPIPVRSTYTSERIGDRSRDRDRWAQLIGCAPGPWSTPARGRTTPVVSPSEHKRTVAPVRGRTPPIRGKCGPRRSPRNKCPPAERSGAHSPRRLCTDLALLAERASQRSTHVRCRQELYRR